MLSIGRTFTGNQLIVLVNLSEEESHIFVRALYVSYLRLKQGGRLPANNFLKKKKKKKTTITLTK
jgi:hypothetical protein